MHISKIYEEAKQSCVICNSCRYCEGLCAVFPAMEKNREFSITEIDHLANLCHQCSECFYDCQYAPPHEFNLAIPQQFAAVRKQSYKKYAFFQPLAKMFDKAAFATTFILIAVFVLGFFIFSIAQADSVGAGGDFYKIIPYNYMVGTFSVVGILVLIALFLSLKNYVKAINMPKFDGTAFVKTLRDIATLKYLGGHENEGCTYPNIERSNIRKIYHHFTAYGFLFCFIATTLGAIYDHFLGLKAPYDLTTLPKIFGTIGGIFLIIGVVGMFILKLKADEEIKDKGSLGLDYALLFMLFIVSASGFLLMFLRESAFLAITLWFHLSCVLALFIMIPYSKFVHMFYRFLSLLKFNTEVKL